MTIIDASAYESSCKRLFGHISPNFSRAEPRQRAWTYIRSLVDLPADRSSRRHVATYPGERRADGAQRLLTSAQWDEDKVKSDLVGLVKNRFGCTGGTLYVTEMAFPKKGVRAAGVERQFSVESMRQENCQIGILLFYEAADGSLVLIDRDLYVPESWINDPDRCRRASVPTELTYRSKSTIGVDLVQRALSVGIAPQWTLMPVQCPDKVVAQQALRREGLQHLMPLTLSEFNAFVRYSEGRAQTVSQETYADIGPDSARARHGQPRAADQPVRAHLRRIKSAVTGTSSRFDVSYLVDSVADRGLERSSGHYYAYSTRDLANGKLVEAVSSLKRLSATTGQVRNEVGIDRYEVRSWRGWYRHMTLAMVAHTAISLGRTEEFSRCA
ncbi:transposase [Streptomyces sioyaensis]|uniref:IS701 family transposase n=1 Tax=Streptomyces sioyaensis TaxID=67364 RepID=UPI0037B45CA6